MFSSKRLVGNGWREIVLTLFGTLQKFAEEDTTKVPYTIHYGEGKDPTAAILMVSHCYNLWFTLFLRHF